MGTLVVVDVAALEVVVVLEVVVLGVVVVREGLAGVDYWVGLEGTCCGCC